jgi:hypothetical protein
LYKLFTPPNISSASDLNTGFVGSIRSALILVYCVPKGSQTNSYDCVFELWLLECIATSGIKGRNCKCLLSEDTEKMRLKNLLVARFADCCHFSGKK